MRIRMMMRHHEPQHRPRRIYTMMRYVIFYFHVGYTFIIMLICSLHMYRHFSDDYAVATATPFEKARRGDALDEFDVSPLSIRRLPLRFSEERSKRYRRRVSMITPSRQIYWYMLHV